MLTPAFSRTSLTSFLMRVVITVVCVIVNTMYSFCIQEYKGCGDGGMVCYGE